jgi:[glutamine synthetase] adenylyltransferase / [glutamine synthetase]-adenylyl-L-tyrosine phosphorylase
VVGLGKLGSRELSIGSDLDLIFIYDAPEDARSDGERPLAAGGYYPRLGQRLVSALTAQTAEGRLYEIDTRLRPSGSVGPVATSLANFERYQRETAQTWEHQALTRARVIAGWGEGADALAARVEAALRAELTRPRDPARLGRDVAAMRGRIFREHGDDDPWNLKHVRGGLIDVEFAAQLLQLRHAAAHPEVLHTNTAEALEAAGRAGVLPAEEAATLAESARLYQRLQAVLRLSVARRFVAAEAPAGLRDALARAASGPDGPPVDFGRLERDLRSAQAEVRRIFDRLCAAPDDDAPEETPG